MICRICNATIDHSYLLHSHRSNLAVQSYYCAACDAFFSDGGKVNYDDVDLTTYYLNSESHIRARYYKIFYFIESLVAVGRFQDIGAGMGFSLEVAKQHGWFASGLEPNAALARHALGRGLDIANTYLNDETSGEYDFVLIDNVLEHILQPIDFLRYATRLVTPAGVMLIAVPPMDWLQKGLGSLSYVRDSVTAPQLNIFGEVDEHVNIFSRKAMGRLLQSVGLRLLDVRFHHSGIYNNALYRGLHLDDGYYFAVRA